VRTASDASFALAAEAPPGKKNANHSRITDRA
jgi:hypothetical protein